MSAEIETLPAEAPAVLAKVKAVAEPARPTLVLNRRDFHWVTEKICGIVEQPAPLWWWVSFSVAGLVASCAPVGLIYLVATGIGVWGLRPPEFWGWDIVNFVFWVGIAHAGTMISSVLCLLRQKWRTAINRSAEATTIFGIMCAGIFPAFHVGRLWFAWWLAPVPNSQGIWPNFHSPLEWDVFAVNTYLTVSLLFWYMGMVPDLATLRDRAVVTWRKYFYGVLALGWRNSTRHWRNYEMAYLIIAGMATSLVVSVSAIVSADFASSLQPGWHTAIFPPYFVAGAVFSGFATVLMLMIPLRALFKLEDLITQYHIDCICKATLAIGSMVAYVYCMEFFIAWYGGNLYEVFTFINRAFGQYAWSYWTMLSCNVLVPQFFWFKKVRRNLPWVFALATLVNVGMWNERFVIIVTSLGNDFVPSSWGYFSPSVVDIFTFFGTMGMFATLFLLFVRFLPMLPISEVKHVMPEADPHYGEPGHVSTGSEGVPKGGGL
jgi:molybdopterin-containing oxidoreductase family membrane subunit